MAKIEKEDEVSKEVKNNFITSSSNSSNITRNLALAQMASIWAVSYKDGVFETNCCLKYALYGLLIFLLIDVFQYCITAITSYCFFKIYTRNKCTREQHENRMTCLSNVVFAMFVIKHLLFGYISYIFLKGFIYQLS